jgi:hypothetical protein
MPGVKALELLCQFVSGSVYRVECRVRREPGLRRSGRSRASPLITKLIVSPLLRRYRNRAARIRCVIYLTREGTIVACTTVNLMRRPVRVARIALSSFCTLVGYGVVHCAVYVYQRSWTCCMVVTSKLAGRRAS